MGFSRTALLAMAAITPGVLQAQDGPGRIVAAADSPSAPSLSLKVLARLGELASTAGADVNMPGVIAEAMGVATAGHPWTVRQFAVQAGSTGVVHAVAVGNGPDRVVMLSVRGPAAISIFRVRPDGTLASGVAYFLETRLTTPLLPAQAATGFAGECAFWATNINTITSSP